MNFENNKKSSRSNFTPEQLAELAEMIGKHANIEQLIVGNSGTVSNYDNRSTGMEVRDFKDKDIVKAVKEVLSAETDDHKRLLSDQQQWYAIYRVLASYCNFPTKMTEFCSKMSTLGIINWLTPDMPPCKVASIQQAGKNLPKLAVSAPATWKEFSAIGTSYEKQWKVALTLMKNLGVVE